MVKSKNDITNGSANKIKKVSKETNQNKIISKNQSFFNSVVYIYQIKNQNKQNCKNQKDQKKVRKNLPQATNQSISILNKQNSLTSKHFNNIKIQVQSNENENERKNKAKKDHRKQNKIPNTSNKNLPNQTNKNSQFNMNYFISKRKHIFQLQLLKYLSYQNIVKFTLVCKNAGNLCDANKNCVRTYQNILVNQTPIQKISNQTENIKPNLLNFWMIIITQQYYSQLLKIQQIVLKKGKETEEQIIYLKQKLDEVEKDGIKAEQFQQLFKRKPIYVLKQFSDYLNQSEILNISEYQEIFEEIKSEKSNQIQAKLISRLNYNAFKENDRLVLQKQIWEQFSSYDATLIVVRSTLLKKFALFIPCKFFEEKEKIPTQKQIIFYFINKNQLVTCINQKEPYFQSQSTFLFDISNAVYILNDVFSLNHKQMFGSAQLDSQVWEGVIQGEDGYPKQKTDWGSEVYYIAGGNNSLFQANSVEFFGLNISKIDYQPQELKKTKKFYTKNKVQDLIRVRKSKNYFGFVNQPKPVIVLKQNQIN